MLNFSSLLLALAAPGALAGAQTNTDDARAIADAGADLAAELIMTGQKRAAIERLELQRKAEPGDAAVLINLGIAYAQMGYDDMARSTFKTAMTARKVEDLATADGRTMDSRRLAREALQMLDRGEFVSS